MAMLFLENFWLLFAVCVVIWVVLLTIYYFTQTDVSKTALKVSLIAAIPLLALNSHKWI